MRSRQTARFPMAGSIPSLAAIIFVTRLEPWDGRFQARNQWGSTATLDRFRQIAARVATGKLATSHDLLMACQVLCVGQQCIDLTEAKDPVGRNRGMVGCCACEGSLMEGTHRLDIITLTVGAQGKLHGQLLCIRESGAVPRVAMTGLVVGSVLVVVFVASYVRRGRSMC
jgi:hypothetical protein